MAARMNLEEYEEFVLSLASPSSTESYEAKIVTAGLGLSGEAGEFADHVKKDVFHKKPMNKESAVKELGDVLWYLAFASRAIGSNLQEVMEVNVAKLSARYKDGVFKTEHAHAQGEPDYSDRDE
jgi:NTP pyrophosphatase (non-canonical NTP hydrolase)